MSIALLIFTTISFLLVLFAAFGGIRKSTPLALGILITLFIFAMLISWILSIFAMLISYNIL